MIRTIAAAAALSAAALATAAMAAAPAPATPNPPEGAWVRNGALPQGQGSLIEQGRAVFHDRCYACHSRPSDGLADKPGTNGLQAKYQGAKPAALEDRTDLTPEIVKFYVRNGSFYMPFFRKTYVSDQELDALAAYLTRPR